MHRRTTKILTDRMRKIATKKEIKKIKKIINSDILWASSNGFYKVKIWDWRLADCMACDMDKINATLKYMDELKEYYEKNGFKVEFSPKRTLSKNIYIEISWENKKNKE